MSSRKLSLGIVLSVLSAIFIIGAGFLFSGCGHKHSFTEWQVVDAADCETAGLETRTCECGEEEFREIPALGHAYGEWQFDEANRQHKRVCERDNSHVVTQACEFDENITLAPQCEAQGLKQLVCRVCQGTTTEIVEALGHEQSDKAVDNENGTHSYHCTRCDHQVTEPCKGDEGGYEFIADGQHKFTCAKCGSFNTETCSISISVIPAECEKDGATVYECIYCKNSTSDPIPQLGHNYGTPEFDPHTHTHIQYCLNNSEHAIKTPCTFEDETHDATCEDDGYTKHTCSECGGYYVDVIPAKGHAYGAWQQSQDGAHTHYRVCGNDGGHIDTQPCEFEYQIEDSTCLATGTKTGTCKDCQRVVTETIEMKEHKYGAWQHVSGEGEDSTHKRTCELCNTTEQTGSCHFEAGEVVKPTCVDQGYTVYTCSDCGFEYHGDIKSELGHDYGEWEFDEHDHYHTCKRDGCDAEERNTHTLNYEYVDATCVDQGSVTEKCQVCKYEKTTMTPANGHTWGPWNITDKKHSRDCTIPDCDGHEEGEHTYFETNLCDACEHDGLEYGTEKNGVSYVVLGAGDAFTAKHITVPALHDTHVVEGIDQYAFRYNKNLQKITLSYGLKFIGMSAFQDCSNLETVELPETLKEIESYAFISCSKLTKINMPDSIETIGDGIINGTAIIRDSKYWEDGKVFYLGKYLFATNNLTGTYEIKDGTIFIERLAFKDNTGLEKIVLPESLKIVDYDAFVGCTNLTAVQYKGDVHEWFNIHFVSHASNPLYLNDNCTLHIDKAEGSITLPQDKNITYIPAGTFRGDKLITSIEIPDTVISIGAGAFDGCTGLQKVVIPASVKDIRRNAFRNCTSLADITISGNVRIEVGAFAGAKFVTDFLKDEDVEEEDSQPKPDVLYVGSNLIIARPTITTCEIKEGTYTIAAEAFKGCTLLESIKMSAELEFIGTGAFDGCTALARADFSSNYKSWWGEQVTPQNVSIFRGIAESELTDQAKAAKNLVYSYKGYWGRGKFV